MYQESIQNSRNKGYYGLCDLNFETQAGVAIATVEYNINNNSCLRCSGHKLFDRKFTMKRQEKSIRYTETKFKIGSVIST